MKEIMLEIPTKDFAKIHCHHHLTMDSGAVLSKFSARRPVGNLLGYGYDYYPPSRNNQLVGRE